MFNFINMYMHIYRNLNNNEIKELSKDTGSFSSIEKM